jgi:hypothetical protein
MDSVLVHHKNTKDLRDIKGRRRRLVKNFMCSVWFLCLCGEFNGSFLIAAKKHKRHKME